MFLTVTNRYRELGLLLLRVGIGLMFMYHGFPKMFGGVAAWLKVGTMAMPVVGITFVPVFWGFMAALAEFGGGLLLILGLFTRLACVLTLFTMVMAMLFKFSTGAGLAGAAESVEMGIVVFSLMFIGPGKYSFDAWLGARSTRSTLRLRR